jgi:predicted RNA-binding protein associated with RNAse of E/G family
MWRLGEWKLASRTFEPPTNFRVLGPNRPFDVWFAYGPDGSVGDWYVNLQAPIVTTEGMILTTDWILDILVSADLNTVTLKDEDELACALALGIFSGIEAARIRGVADEVRRNIRSGCPPWDLDWPNRIKDGLTSGGVLGGLADALKIDLDP